jgi:RHS repeat-associated protein
MKPLGFRKWLLAVTLALAVYSLAMPMARKRPLKPARPQNTPSFSVVGQTATLLPNGKLLLVGGEGPQQVISTVALRDPQTGVTVPLPYGLLFPRAWHTATLLPDGSVLVLGGIGSNARIVTAAERLDPATGQTQIVDTAGLRVRAHHTATLLTDGRVLIAGGVSDAGEVLGTGDLWDSRTSTAPSLPTNLLIPMRDQTASLLPSGEVLLWGGTDNHGIQINFGQIFDPASLSFRLQTAPVQSQSNNQPPVLEVSIPTDRSENIALDPLIAFRFSKALSVITVNSGTVKLTGPSGPLAAKVIPAEGGMLAFVTPQSALIADTSYTLSLTRLSDPIGNALPQTLVTFTTAGSADTTGLPFGPDGTNNSGTNGMNSGFQQMPPLQAPPGVTALSGQSLKLNGLPLEDLSLTVEDQNITAATDGTGRFLLTGLSAGHHVVFVDGRTASKKGQTYGTYEIGIDIAPGKTNVLTYTIWMTELDTAHTFTIPSPTTSEVMVTTPALPGLELHIPAGTVIRDHEGNVVTQVSITPIPIAQPPFPLPRGVKVPIYFTIQPGGAYLQGYGQNGFAGARLFYPNPQHLRSGTSFNFWNYDADEKGWYVYGQGTVSGDTTQIVPNPGVVIYEFTGAMVGNPPAPSSGPPAGSAPQKDGEPVDLQTGLFVYTKTDLFLTDVIPLQLIHTYRQMDSTSRGFGIGTTLNYDIFLTGDTNPYTYVDLILPDGGRIHFDRVSSGTSYNDAVYEHTTSPTAFYGAQIIWINPGWLLTLKNGTQYVFPDCSFTNRPQQCAPLQMIDRNGNTVKYTRDSNSNLTQVTSPNGRWIQFSYDSSTRITQATDNSGRSVYYTYDAGGRLSTVKDANGGTTTFGYDSNNNMTTIKDARGIVYLTNYYDANNMVYKQVLADGSTYLFNYTGVNSPCFASCPISGSTITETDVTDPRQNVRQVHFNSDGYMSSQAFAAGKPEQQSLTYSREAGSGLILNETDALNRETSFTYDSMGNITSITRLAGTANAVTTTFAYNSAFSEITSVTDPLGRATSLQYDNTGNLIRITDASGITISASYNFQGRPVTLTDGAGNSLQLSYNGGDLVGITDSLGRSAAVFTDAIGRRVSVTDQAGQSTQFTWNSFDLITGVTDPRGNITNFSWDPNGNLLSVQDANQHRTSYTYDNMDRLATRTDPLLAQESYQYDGNGNLMQFTDRRNKITSYSYDGLNRRTFSGFGTTSGPTYESTINYNYDGGNRFTSVVDSVAGTITPTFDNLDRLTKEVSPQGTVNYTYDSADRRMSTTVTGQAAVNYSYDNSNRLIGLTQGTSTSVSLAYDSANRRTSLTLPNGIVIGYSYDNASELSGLTYTLGTNTLGNLIYSYDLVGRRINMGGSLAQQELPLAISTTAYNANNQLTTWGTANLFYDANGNMTSDGTNSYTWNARNQLASMNFNNVSFRYDSYGRRTGKTISGSTTSYLYAGANVVQELSGSTVTANLLSGRIDEVFTRTDSNGAANFLPDALGSTVELTGPSGNMLASYAYEPFGNTTVTSGSSANPYQYTGRENDGTGLYYYRARYYNPSLQRFISEDPLGFAANSVNFYEYTYDNPTRFVDPSGLQEILLTTDPVYIDPELFQQAADLADPKQSLPMPDGGRLDLTGKPHIDPATGDPIPTPHVHDPLPPFEPPYDNFPRGLNPVPRPATPDDFAKAIQQSSQPAVPLSNIGGGNPMTGRKSPADNPNPDPNFQNFCRTHPGGCA